MDANTQSDVIGTDLPTCGEDGLTTDLRVRHKARMDTGPLPDDYVRGILADCTNFLRQLVRITSDVVETVSLAQVRQIVAAELALPSHIIREDGSMSNKPTQPVDAPDRDHRKNPRGRKHPVITLLQMALSGIRLLLQITAGTNPNVQNRESLGQKREREELKEQEREISKILSGRA
jgi:hypothetical protein